MFLKALALYRERSVTMLEELAAQEAPPLQKLEAICEATLYPHEEAMRRGCFMVNTVLEFGADDQEVNREAELMSDQVEHILEEIILSGQERQLITTRQTSKELAALLNNVLNGAKVMEKSGASRERVDAVLSTAFTLLAPENGADDPAICSERRWTNRDRRRADRSSGYVPYGERNAVLRRSRANRLG